MTFGTTELLLVLAITALVFGTRKIRSVGGDLGGALKGFRKAMSEEPEEGKQEGAAGSDKAAKADPPRGDGNGEGS